MVTRFWLVVVTALVGYALGATPTLLAHMLYNEGFVYITPDANCTFGRTELSETSTERCNAATSRNDLADILRQKRNSSSGQVVSGPGAGTPHGTTMAVQPFISVLLPTIHAVALEPMGSKATAMSISMVIGMEESFGWATTSFEIR